MGGIQVLISSFWTFNLCFNSNCQKFLAFICGYMSKLPKVKIPNSVSQVINAM